MNNTVNNAKHVQVHEEMTIIQNTHEQSGEEMGCQAPSCQATLLIIDSKDETVTSALPIDDEHLFSGALDELVTAACDDQLENECENEEADDDRFESHYYLSCRGESPDQVVRLLNSIGYEPRLGVIDLPKCGLVCLPDAIGDLPALTWFNVPFNKALRQLPPTLSKCNSLCYVNITGCGFEEFPKALTSLPQLKQLECANNMIGKIPPEISRLRSLVQLNFRHNLLEELPQAFCGLVGLRVLDLCENKLSHLPENFGELRNLDELDVSKNCLTRLPDFEKTSQSWASSSARKPTYSIGRVDWSFGLPGIP